jgi:hypothetical protein
MRQRAWNDVRVRTWRFDASVDPLPEVAQPGDVEARRAVFLAAPSDKSAPQAWIAVDDYHEGEGVLLFGAPAGERFHEYVRALLPAAIKEARNLGFTSLLAHWRGGWSTAEVVLREFGFAQAAPGIWRRRLTR